RHGTQGSYGPAPRARSSLRVCGRHRASRSHVPGTRALRTGRPTGACSPLHLLQHSRSMRPRHGARVPSIPFVRAGLGAGGRHTTARGRGAGRRAAPQDQRTRGSGEPDCQDAGPATRESAAGPSLTSHRDAFPCRLSATPLEWRATTSILPEIPVQLPFTHLPDVFLPLLSLVLYESLLDVCPQRVTDSVVFL